MTCPGSKAGAGVWQRIIGQMPPHSIYVEPFFGSGQVFWRKRRSAHSIVIDRRADLLAKVGAEAGVIAISGDAISLLPTLTLGVDALIYCDPPYLLSTRNGRAYFQHELTDRQHSALLRVLKRMNCRVMVSGYPSALYSSQLSGWRCVSYRTRTRGRTVTECLWCNFPESAELHDWRYAGNDFRQRLAYKRLATRWLTRLEGMAARKRGYVLQAVQSRFSMNHEHG